MRVPIPGLLQGIQAVTVELWLRPDSIGERGSPPEFLLSAHREGDGRTDQNTDMSVSLRDSREDRLPYLNVRRRADGTCGNVTGSPASRQALVPGRWYHFVASFERNAEGHLATHTYLDGSSVAHSVGSAPDEPCVAPLELTLCQGVTPTGLFTRPFVGAIDDVRISRGVRYRDRFVPAVPQTDDDTLLLLRFDDGTLLDLGPKRLRPTSIGSVELVDTGR